MMAAKFEPLPPVLKGKSDWREYRGFRLPNGVTCMVVNDKESKTTAMSCSVAVGAAADPRSMSGLAHFCEHMCFLGSEKYPGENEYKQYLSSHGGRSNASTSLHLTTYKFDVVAPHAEHAVDVFSNFFIAPLFSLSGTSREVQAVDSENSKNLTSDLRRRLQILKALADTNHYYSKFTTGNALTLPAESEETERIRAALLAFHRHHYTPQNMTVTLVGPQSLDELQRWIVPRFGVITAKPMGNPDGEVEKLILDSAKDAPNYIHGQPIPDYNPAFSSELQSHQWPILLTVKPLSAVRKLTLNFPLPAVRHLFNSNPIHLLSHLLGHEGPNSSFAILQSAGLLTSLSSGNRISGPDQSLFQLELSLTEEGEKQWKSVVALLLEHCRLIAQAPDLARHWDETRRLAEIQFDHTSPGQAYDAAPNLAQSIVAHGTKYCRSAGMILDKDVPNAQEFALYLKADNMIVERCSEAAWAEMEAVQDFGGDDFGKKTESWYGIDYYVKPVNDYAQWNKMEATQSLDPSQLALPKPNMYLPRTLDLVDELPPEAKAGPRIEKEIDPPKLVVSSQTARLWHRLDDRYALPRASVNFFIRNGAVEHSLTTDGEWEFDPQASIHSTMLAGAFTQAMAQDTYDAELAGLSWNLNCSASGVRITCSGYSDRLSDLAIKILQDFLDGSFIQDSYVESTRDRVIRSLRTYFSARRADSIAMHYQDLLLNKNQCGIDVSLKLAEKATLESFKAQHRRIVGNMEVEVDCLYMGNVSEKTAREYFANAMELLKVPECHKEQVRLTGPDTRRVAVGANIETHFNSQNASDENGAVIMAYISQIPGFRGTSMSPKESLLSSASIRLICHMLREPLFNTLRTKQQLGYIVQSWHDLEFSFVNDVSTPMDIIAVNVLSRKVSPPEVTARIDDFMSDFRNSLMNMPESEIRDHADALSAKLLKPTQKLGAEASNHFAKIRRYGPEILRRAGGSGADLPWKSVNDIAGAIQALQRQDLVDTWDRVVLGPDKTRVTNMVYGTTFPLDEKLARSRETRNTKVAVNDAMEIVKIRETLKAFENNIERRNALLRYLPTSTPGRLGVAAAVVGIVGFTIQSSRRKR